MSQATRRPRRASSAHSLAFFGFCSMRTQSWGSSTCRSPDCRKRRTPRPPPKSFSKATRMTPAVGTSSASPLSLSAIGQASGGLAGAGRAAAVVVAVAAAREAVDQLDQLLGTEGLRDVGVEARFERAGAILVGGEGGDGDAGHRAR